MSRGRRLEATSEIIQPVSTGTPHQTRQAGYCLQDAPRDFSFQHKTKYILDGWKLCGPCNPRPCNQCQSAGQVST